MIHHLVFLGYGNGYQDLQARVKIAKEKDPFCEVAVMAAEGAGIQLPRGVLAFAGAAASILRTVRVNQISRFISIYPTGFVPSPEPYPTSITHPYIPRLELPTYGASTPWALTCVDVDALELDVPDNGSEAVGMYLGWNASCCVGLSGTSQYMKGRSLYHADKCLDMPDAVFGAYKALSWDEAVRISTAASDDLLGEYANVPKHDTLTQELAMKTWKLHTAGLMPFPFEYYYGEDGLQPSGTVQHLGKYDWCYFGAENA
jgi:hypothetical protein